MIDCVVSIVYLLTVSGVESETSQPAREAEKIIICFDTDERPWACSRHICWPSSFHLVNHALLFYMGG